MTAQIYTATDPDVLPGVTWINDVRLRETAFPETQYLILNMLPAGYTVVIGAPKTGKTALALPLAQRLVLADYRVLYLVLDDSLSRMKTRSIMALPATDPTYSPMDGLWYVNGWQPKGADQAFAQLRSWIERWRDYGQPFDLVIVDTYGRFAGKKPQGAGIFEHDYSIGSQFKALYSDYGLSTMLNHHARKRGGDDVDWLDMVSGSAGMTAAADAIWYIERTRGTRSGILRVTGNDMEESEHPVILGPDMVWRGDHTVTPGQARHSGVMRAVLDYMLGESQVTAKSLAEEVGASQNTIHQCLQRLAAEGLVAFGNKVWELTGHSDNRIVNEEMMVIPRKASTVVVLPAGSVQSEAPGIGSPQPGGSVGGASGSPGAGAPFEAVAPVPEALSSPDAPEAPTVPAQRDPRHDADPAEPWCDDAIAPLPSGEGAVGAMIETLKAARLPSGFRLTPEVKAVIPGYDQMMLGGTPNTWPHFPHRRPTGTVVAFDRKASYYSSRCWLVLKTLTRTGPMDWDQIKREKRGGIFEIAPERWQHPDLPSPYGARGRVPAKLKVSRAVLNRLQALSKEGLVEFPPIISTLSGRASENLLQPWFDWCLTQRRECAHDPEMAAMRKADQNNAIGLLRVHGEYADGTPKRPGPIDRPDWQYEIISQHYMMMNYYGHLCMAKGDPLIAIGNTDELVFLLPPGEDAATWVPEGLKPLVERNKFSRKMIGWDPAAGWTKDPTLPARDAGEWFDAGGLRGQRPA
jgi:hypothetical protein